MKKKEEKFLRYIAEQAEKKPGHSVEYNAVKNDLRIDTGLEVRQLAEMFKGLGCVGSIYEVETGSDVDGSFVPAQKAVLDARTLDQPKDWVAGIEGWARTHPITAVAIVIFQAAGAIVGLIGGILGIFAFCATG